MILFQKLIQYRQISLLDIKRLSRILIILINLAINKFRRVLSPGNSFLYNRITQGPPQKHCINLPKFDRGRRKISKMGGIPSMFVSFRSKNISNSLATKEGIMNDRRFTSASPTVTNKFNTPIMKKQTYTTNEMDQLIVDSNNNVSLIN